MFADKIASRASAVQDALDVEDKCDHICDAGQLLK